MFENANIEKMIFYSRETLALSIVPLALFLVFPVSLLMAGAYVIGVGEAWQYYIFYL